MRFAIFFVFYVVSHYCDSSPTGRKEPDVSYTYKEALDKCIILNDYGLYTCAEYNFPGGTQTREDVFSECVVTKKISGFYHYFCRKAPRSVVSKDKPKHSGEGRVSTHRKTHVATPGTSGSSSKCRPQQSPHRSRSSSSDSEHSDSGLTEEEALKKCIQCCDDGFYRCVGCWSQGFLNKREALPDCTVRKWKLSKKKARLYKCRTEPRI